MQILNNYSFNINFHSNKYKIKNHKYKFVHSFFSFLNNYLKLDKLNFWVMSTIFESGSLLIYPSLSFKSSGLISNTFVKITMRDIMQNTRQHQPTNIMKSINNIIYLSCFKCNVTFSQSVEFLSTRNHIWQSLNTLSEY